jgi:molecular chaperone GrpE
VGAIGGMSEKVRTESLDEGETDQSQEQANDKNIPENHESQETQEPEPETAGQEDLAARVAASEEQAKEYYDRLLRISAEFDNYKKRSAREMQEVVKYANERLVKELLPVVDNLERAIMSVKQKAEAEDPLLQGVSLTLGEILKILERHKVFPIESLGQPFDPNYHQAMMQEEVTDKPPNIVTREMQKGYMIHDRLLRPALVAVSKTGSEPADNKNEI